jgi:hypothetical protein
MGRARLQQHLHHDRREPHPRQGANEQRGQHGDSRHDEQVDERYLRHPVARQILLGSCSCGGGSRGPITVVTGDFFALHVTANKSRSCAV